MGDDGLWDRLLALAERGRYSTSPNPRVGALVVAAGGEVVGEGWHERAGSPHAEAAALAAAGERARGATVYVNLEPCAHTGRTPPCADALVRAGVARVVASLPDPDPRTSGRGFAALRDAGVEVEVGARRGEAERLNEAFLLSANEGRPFVHLKWAASLDGKTASRTGASRWITGTGAREESMRLREEADAILVGAGTVLADDPLLTRRLGLNRSVVPHRRIVLDGALRSSPSARLFDPALPGEAWLVTARPAGEAAAFAARGVTVASLPGGGGSVDLAALLARLHALEVRSLLVEGGGETAWGFLAAGLADRVTAFVAPILVGGREAPTPLAGLGAPDLDAVPRLEALEVARFGADLKVTGRVSRPRPGAGARA